MAPIPLKRIVSISSEDASNPASNLLSAGGKWLCAVGNKTRTAEALIELPKRVRIAALEICNCGSAFVEVFVSDSSKPEDEVVLLSMVMLMTANDSRAEKNTNKMARYGKEKLSTAATDKKWNRIRVRCVQKHNLSAQFGLRSFSVFTDSRDSTATSSQHIGTQGILSPSPARAPGGGAVATPRQETPSHRHPHNKYPTLPPSDYRTSQPPQPETPKGIQRSSQTPKRLKEKKEGGDEDFEFSGVEKQSRLFHECLKGKGEGSADSKKGSNAILDRIAANAEKYSPSYHKKRLLKKAIPKADLMKDFVESYKIRDKGDLMGAARKMSSLDNDNEIGEEPERTWGEGGWPKKPARGWSKSKATKPKKPRARSGGVRKKKHSTSAGKLINWLSTRKKLDENAGDTADCNDAVLKDSKLLEEDSFSDSLDESDGKAVDADDLEAAVTSPPGSKGDKAPSSLTECPLCQCFFPSYAVEVHASQCMTSDPSTPHPTSQTPIITID